MSIAIFFITHEGIASNLLDIGKAILQKPIGNLTFQEVAMDAPIEETVDAIEKKLESLSIENGLFFITDIYGSTPSNIAQQLASKYKAQLISGVNLPMVIRLLSYREQPSDVLLLKALDGAHKGIQNYNF